MSRNEKTIPIFEKIISLINSGYSGEDEILTFLHENLKTSKVPDGCNLYYCHCGYPLGFKIEEIDHKNESSFRYVLLDEILNYEADFDKFKTYTYCPNCNRLVNEVQH